MVIDTLLRIVSDLVSSESDPSDILRMAKHASEAIRTSNIKEMDRILELHSRTDCDLERIRAFEAFTSGPNHRGRMC